MGLWGPPSSPFELDIEEATSERNTNENWPCIMEICDRITPATAKEGFKTILKRLQHTDPHVTLKALTLLDACISNCGKSFHLEVASREFEDSYRKLIKNSNLPVQQKLKEYLKKWAEGEFKDDPELSLLPSLYNKLRQEGVDFNVHTTKTNKSYALPKDPNVVTSQKEQDDIAKAIELSLKEAGSSKNSTPKNTSTAASSLYPSTNQLINKSKVSSDAKKVRALYDFEAAEDNELTFKAGELIAIIDDADPNWWKGSNQRGEGLFPANFVTTDLSAVPEQFKVTETKKTVQFNDNVDVKQIENVVKNEPNVITQIEETKIDRLIYLLHEANPNSDESSDSDELKRLEKDVDAMGPLIDQELEVVDRRHATLTQLSSDLVDALNLYHTLMREPTNLGQGISHTLPNPKMMGAYMPNHMYNGLPPQVPHQQWNGPASHLQQNMTPQMFRFQGAHPPPPQNPQFSSMPPQLGSGQIQLPQQNTMVHQQNIPMMGQPNYQSNVSPQFGTLPMYRTVQQIGPQPPPMGAPGLLTMQSNMPPPPPGLIQMNHQPSSQQLPQQSQSFIAPPRPE